MQRAREIYALAKAGDISGCSIGYSVSPGGSYRKGDVRYLQKVQLTEISICLFPMNDKARITGTKAAAKAAAEMAELKKVKSTIERITLEMQIYNLLSDMRNYVRRSAT